MTPSNPIIDAKGIPGFIDDDAVYEEGKNNIFLRGRVHNIIKEEWHRIKSKNVK